MNDYWEFSGIQRLFLFVVLLVQWQLTMLLVKLALQEHGDPGSASAAPLNTAYWVVIGGLVLSLFAAPMARMAADYGPKAYGLIKGAINT